MMNKKHSVAMPNGEVIERTVYEYRFGYMLMLVIRHKNRHWFVEQDHKPDGSVEHRAIRRLTLEEYCYINPFATRRGYINHRR